MLPVQAFTTEIKIFDQQKSLDLGQTLLQVTHPGILLEVNFFPPCTHMHTHTHTHKCEPTRHSARPSKRRLQFHFYPGNDCSIQLKRQQSFFSDLKFDIRELTFSIDVGANWEANTFELTVLFCLYVIKLEINESPWYGHWCCQCPVGSITKTMEWRGHWIL